MMCHLGKWWKKRKDLPLRLSPHPKGHSTFTVLSVYNMVHNSVGTTLFCGTVLYMCPCVGLKY